MTIIFQVVISYGDWFRSSTGPSAVLDYECKTLLLSSSQSNLLVMLFESSCTLWDVIYSDSLNITAEAWGDKWFDEAMYLLSNAIMFWMCSSSDSKFVF